VGLEVTQFCRKVFEVPAMPVVGMRQGLGDRLFDNTIIAAKRRHPG
jgi:hypothetical protein